MSAPQGLSQKRPVENQLTNEEVQPCPNSLHPAGCVALLFKKQVMLILIFKFTLLTWEHKGDEVTVMQLCLDVYSLEDEICFFYFVLQTSLTSLRLSCSWGWPQTSDPRFITSWIQMLGLQAWTTMPSFVRPGIKPRVSCMQSKYSDNGAETPTPRMSPVHPLSNNCSLVMGLLLMKREEGKWGRVVVKYLWFCLC